jgi:lipopolysaccharide export LptBFGC system permease protein LptF
VLRWQRSSAGVARGVERGVSGPGARNRGARLLLSEVNRPGSRRPLACVQTNAAPTLPIGIELDEDLREAPFSEYRHRRWWYRTKVPYHLWRYIGIEVLRIAVLTILTVSLFYAALTAYQVVRGGVRISYIWPFLAKAVAYPLYFSIPLGFLFGLTLSLGRMVADYEYAAMRSHGASHGQLYVPVIALGLIAAFAAHRVNGWVIPELRYERRNLEQYVLRQLENLGTGKNRTIPLPDDGGTLLVGAYEGTRLWNIQVDLNRNLQSRFVPEIRDQLPNRLPETVTFLAKLGRLEIRSDLQGVVLHLRGVGVLVPEKAEGGRFYQHPLITEDFAIPISFEAKARGIKDRTRPDLARHIDELERRAEASPEDSAIAKALTGARAEWHRRTAFTASAILFPILGASLCFLLQGRGRLVPFFVGNLLVLGIFYPCLMVGSAMAERGVWPWLALSLPIIALGIASVVLVRRVVRQ